MSSFYAYDFVYDGIPSQKFGLKIITFEDGGVFSGVGSSDVEIISQSVLRKSKPYYLGRTQSTILQFPLTFGTAYPISGFERDLISKWLFGRAKYKKLYIMQDDLNGAYFNCFLTQPKPIYIGGMNYAFSCNVTCDSPWAYGIEHNVSGSVVGLANNYGPDYRLDVYNGSSEDDYIYPILEFKFISINGENPYYPYGAFIITNTSDVYNPNGISRRFEFKDLDYATSSDNPYYYVRTDNDLQIIYSQEGENGIPTSGALQYFNKSWFRLVPGLNKLAFMVGGPNDVVEFTIRWRERMKIGG